MHSTRIACTAVCSIAHVAWMHDMHSTRIAYWRFSTYRGVSGGVTVFSTSNKYVVEYTTYTEEWHIGHMQPSGGVHTSNASITRS